MPLEDWTSLCSHLPLFYNNAAAAVGLGLYEEGDASISLGTSGVIFGSTKRFLKNYDDAIHSFCHCLPKTWHLMSVMLSCTSNINWFINTFNSSLKEITDQLKNLMLSEIQPIRLLTILGLYLLINVRPLYFLYKIY